MLRRKLCLVRAWSAAGLLTCSIFAIGNLLRAGEPNEPAPGPQAAADTVAILDAQKDGLLRLELRGQGVDHVRFSVRNTSQRRLNVVLPPGLVAASTTGQLQSMGLGTPTTNAGSFGSFRSNEPQVGFRSVSPAPGQPAGAVTVPAGETVDFSVPSVCLNFGLPTPTPRDVFKLVDVDDYSPDPHVRKMLRTVATLGTSHGVAQAAMWRVCNHVPFEMMTAQFPKVVNPYEAALAARLVDALDAGGSSTLVEPAYLTEGRILVQLRADGDLASQAQRLSTALDGLRVLGLPVRVLAEGETPAAQGPALLLGVSLAPGRAGETRLRITARHATASGWAQLGIATYTEGSAPEVLDGPSLARALDRAVATAFVSVKPARRSVGNTTFKIENGLPFSISHVWVKAGTSAGAPSVSLPGMGIGPARAGLAPVEAPRATIERVELNGL